MSGVETDYISTRGEALPPPETPPARTRRARPEAGDNPLPAPEREPPEQHQAPEPDAALSAMSARAQEAERRAAEAERKNTDLQRERDEMERGRGEAQAQTVNAQKQALEAAIAAEDRRVANARASYKAAREAGDFEAEVAANEELAEAKGRRLLLDRDKAAWADYEVQQAAEAEARRKSPPPQETRPAAQPQPQPGQPAALLPSDQAWADRHPDFLNDPECEQWIRAAAGRVINDGTAHGTKAFYRELDHQYDRYQRLRDLDQQDSHGGQREPAEPEPVRQQPRRGAPSAASMAPSPSRGGGDNGGGRQRSVTPAMVARRMNMSEQELADFARGRRGGLQGYVNEVAKELGMI